MADEGAGRSLSGAEYKELCKALLQIFSTRADLKQFVRFELGESLDAIAKDDDTSKTVFQLVEHVESEGRTLELAEKALAQRPKHVGLGALVNRLRGSAPAAADASGPAPEHVFTTRLPVPGKYLFGRDAELARLDAAWSDPRVHLLSIVAMGGAGKTALVDGWLKRMEREGWRGAGRVYGWSFYSQGSSNTASGEAFIAEALRWFGDADPAAGSAWDKGERLARLVKQHRTLLVLDGLEPLQAPPGVEQGKIRDPGVAALVRSLAAGGSGLCVISTRFPISDLAPREDGAAPKIDLDELSPHTR
jgi:Effector-associated domain 1